jgi:hypothetical protein
MAQDILHNPEHWLARATEARTIAAQTSSDEVRETMLRIALDHEHLAKRAAARSLKPQ